jgi:hypothetical protein
MRQTTTYQLLQVRLTADLAEWVAARRADGRSWRAIAHEASTVTGVNVSHETLRAWFAERAA